MITKQEEEKIIKGACYALINPVEGIENDYTPELITNNYERGEKVLTVLEKELQDCDSFYFSCAFITSGGITPLLSVLKELEKRNIPGKILTTDYLYFSQPKILDKLANMNNIELKMFCCKDSGFHTKGYIFKKHAFYNIIIGSSNLTQDALTRNHEWNLQFTSYKNGALNKDMLDHFNQLWFHENSIPWKECRDEYLEKYKEEKKFVQFSKKIAQKVLKPNKMQQAFTRNLRELVDQGEKKALLISATGTGKTYASAFAMKDLKPKRILFAVHREQIAKQALKTFKRVLGSDITYGLLSGNNKDIQADCLFSTIQTLSKEDILHSFSPEAFDIIIIDEVHRAGAKSYQRIMDYFKPNLWLGMTASPDRSDGFDIYELFDHNIVYDIRLQQALEEDLLCPFHYFGLSDLTIEGIDEIEDPAERFKLLSSKARAKHVLEQADYFGHSGNRVKGLIFCSTNEEAKALSEKMNELGKRTVALSGKNSQEEREAAIERLTNDNSKDPLDYILTVDIFNEGVDIPDVNQVIMLRPTESAIVFIQQLGRGLRKAKGKEYVVVLDFIGNYNNNFLIPIALSGDNSYNKDNIRKYVLEGTKTIPGASTIHFDEVSKKKIFAAIDQANFQDVKLLKEKYQQLKYMLGRIPTLRDFDKFGSIDPLRIIESQGSYYKFLKKYEKEYDVDLSNEEELYLKFISQRLANGKRKAELIILEEMIHNEHLNSYEWKELLEKHDVRVSEHTIPMLINILSGNYDAGTGSKTFKNVIFIQEKDGKYEISGVFKNMLKNEDFKKWVLETIHYGLYRNEKDYGDLYEDTNFKLYSKYTYEDVFRLLEWPKSEVTLNVGGYKYHKDTNTYPVFINYDKEEDIADSQKYEDHFVSPEKLIAFSKSNRRLDSADVQTALNADKTGTQMHLFVRKNKDDKISKEFYYLGKIHSNGIARPKVMPNKNKTNVVELEYLLNTPVHKDIYDYITS